MNAHFCADYQRPKISAGRPFCQHRAHLCALGRHSCVLCGKPGHGASNCHTHNPAGNFVTASDEVHEWDVNTASREPWPLVNYLQEPPVVNWPQPVLPSPPPPPHRENASFKGYGKGGNYGREIPPPKHIAVPSKSRPTEWERVESAAFAPMGVVPTIPTARGPTPAELADWCR